MDDPHMRLFFFCAKFSIQFVRDVFRLLSVAVYDPMNHESGFCKRERLKKCYEYSVAWMKQAQQVGRRRAILEEPKKRIEIVVLHCIPGTFG